MALATWQGGSKANQMTATFLVSSNTNTHTFIISLANPAGIPSTAVTMVTVTADGVLTTAQLASAIKTAWDALTHPWALAIAASVDTSTVTFTSTKPGVPFTMTKSGSGTSTLTTTIANRGPEDYSDGGNWVEGIIPAASADVLIQGPYSIKYGLSQSSISLTSFTRANHYGTIGSANSPLTITTSAFTHDCSGPPAYIDLAASTCAPLIVKTGGGAPYGLYLKGSALSNNSALTPFVVEGGRTAIAYQAGETATVQYMNVNGGGHLYVGAGVTFTTLRQRGGSTEIRASTANAITLIEVNGADSFSHIEGTNTSTTIAALTNNGAQIVCNHYAAIALNTNTNGGHTDYTQSRRARTVTQFTNTNGGRVSLDTSVISVTTFLPPASYTGSGSGDGGGPDNG